MANESVPNTELSDYIRATNEARMREFGQAIELTNQRYMSELHHTGPAETFWNPRDRFERRMSQAYAMLTVIGAEGLESFDDLNDSIRMDYIQAIQDLIGAARIDGELAFDRGPCA